MANRRSFIAGMFAAGALPRATWAQVGSPAFLSAGMAPDGTFVLCGLSRDGQITFQRSLPARGHAAAAHPVRAEAVAFARRPGTFAIVLDCATGTQTAQLDAPYGRHFYGHGAFSPDGDLLFTTENDFDAGRGVIGVWDVSDGYRRLGEVGSGGVGPHDIKLMPDGASLVIANGGIETHPETGRTKLNIPTMRPNLSYIDFDGQLLDQIELDPAHRKNSIRHLAVSAQGSVVFAMQWQGDLTEDLPLLGVHNSTAGTVDLVGDASVQTMNGYLGSVAVSRNGAQIATTSPRSGTLQIFEGPTLRSETRLRDICGVAATDTGFYATTGTGLAVAPSGQRVAHPVAWDNHLVPI
ncbi:DUF1513 domain-containing protein [uncultured Tateyamaria sp.]|uniref:DUF1513 domain-containing protein n=1 Tax=uncultured Tateyamaria sp. TaxID=455651 RepID=UPI00262EC02B|nr:DUF1513 domain-containing protein [uncultured Tateyamaria sp.]